MRDGPGNKVDIPLQAAEMPTKLQFILKELQPMRRTLAGREENYAE